MLASEELFELISRLNSSEKRYFKAFCQKQTHDNQPLYLHLFEILEKMEKWDREVLNRAVADSGLKDQLGETMNYLQKTILASLRQFHRVGNVAFRIREMLMNVELLLDKEMHSAARKELNRLRKLALKMEKLETLPEINSLELTLHLRERGVSLARLGEKLNSLLADTRLHSERFLNQLTYKKLSLEMFLLSRREQNVAGDRAVAAYQSLLNDPALIRAGQPSSLKSRIFHLQALSIYHMAARDTAACLDASAQIVSLMESYPELIAERPENYLASLQNLVNMSLMAGGPPGDTLVQIQKLKSMAEDKPGSLFARKDRNRALLFAWLNELSIYYETGQSAKAQALTHEVTHWLDHARLPAGVNEGYAVNALRFVIAKIHLSTRHYDQALQAVNQILNSGNIDPQFELYLSARMLQLILFLERGETTMLGYAENSLRRFMMKRGALHPAERILLQFIKGSTDDGVTGDRGMLRRQLEEAMKIAPRPAAFSQFDVLRWLRESN